MTTNGTAVRSTSRRNSRSGSSPKRSSRRPVVTIPSSPSPPHPTPIRPPCRGQGGGQIGVVGAERAHPVLPRAEDCVVDGLPDVEQPPDRAQDRRARIALEVRQQLEEVRA